MSVKRNPGTLIEPGIFFSLSGTGRVRTSVRFIFLSETPLGRMPVLEILVSKTLGLCFYYIDKYKVK